MAKLTDTQSILLVHAAQQDGSLYPLPASQLDDGNPSDRALKAINQLLGRGLIVGRETNAAATICRTEGDLGYGMFVTSIGLTAIGIDDGAFVDDATPTPPQAAPAPRQTKAATVLALLQREEGATLAELIDATGWLPHTIRAALTGLRKRNGRR